MTEPDEAALRTVKMLMAFEAPASLTIEQAKFLTPVIARALMAERERTRAEEREMCAAFIETHAYAQNPEGPVMVKSKHAIYDVHHRTIAAAIRKGEHHD